MLALVFGVPLFRSVMGVAVPLATSLIAATAMLVATMAWLELARRVACRAATRAAPH
jgi:Ca2+-transporting ATPase